MNEDMTAGQKEIASWKAAGFTDEEVDQQTSKDSAAMLANGFSTKEVNDYYGKKDLDEAPLQKAAQAGVAKATTDIAGKPKREPIDVSPKPVEPKDVLDAMAAAYGNSILQLSLTGQESPIKSPDDQASWQMHVGHMLSGFIADSPVMFAGGLSSGPAGAFGLPAALRATLVDAIRSGKFMGGSDFAKRATKIGWETGKGVITGAATGAAGAAVGELGAAAEGLGELGVPGAGAISALSGRAGQIGAELTAQTVVSNALEGQLPKARDFTNGAIAIGGLEAMLHVPGKMMDIYAKSGAKPAEVLQAAMQEPKVRGELLSDNPNLPTQADRGHIEVPSLEEQEKIGLKPSKDPAVDAAGKEIQSRIAEPKPDKSMIEKGVDIKNALYKWWIDTNDFTRSVGNVMKEQGLNDLPAEDNAHKLMNLYPAYIDKVQMAMHQGTLDFKTKTVNGEPFDKITGDYVKEFPDDPKQTRLKNYEIAKQSLDLDARGIKKVGSRENDQIFVDAWGKKLQPYLDRKVDWESRNMQYLVDSKRISQARMDRIEKANPNHTPLHVVDEPDDMTGKGMGGGLLKRIKGSDRLLIDPDVSRLKSADMFYRQAEENHIKKTFFESQMSLPEEQRVVRKVKADIRPIHVSSEEASDALAKQGIDLQPDDITIFRPKDRILTSGQTDFYDGDKMVVFEGRPDIIDSLNRLKGDRTSTNVWTTLLRPMSTALRALTVNNPFFGLRHTGKNQYVGAGLSQTGYIPGQGWANIGIGGAKEAFDQISQWRSADDAVKSMNQIKDIVNVTQGLMNNDPEFQKFVANGGAVNAVVPLDKGYLDGEIYKLTNKSGSLGKLWNTVKSIGTMTHAGIVLGDNLVRFEEFKGLAKKFPEMSDMERAYQARQVLPDYMKAGLQKGALNTIKAFLKVHMISTDRMAVELADPEKRYDYMLRNAMWIGGTSMMFAAANHGDEAIDDVKDHDKAVNWVTRIDNWRPANSIAEAMSRKDAYASDVRDDGKGGYEINDGKIWRFPKPFLPGIVFGSGPEAILESWKKSDPKAFMSWVGEMARQVAVSPIPDLPTPMAEHLLNRNFWNNQPLVRQPMQNKLPWEQYDQYTTETGKLIGRALGYVPVVRDWGPSDAHLSSPKVVDNYLHSFGTLGNYIVDASDKALRLAGIAPPDPGRIKDMDSFPFLREFMIAHPGSEPQSVQDFLDRYKKADQVISTLKDLGKKGDINEYNNIQSRFKVNMYRLRGVDKDIANAHQTIANIDLDPKMPEGEKRQTEQLLYYQMVSWSKYGNKLMDEFEKAAKNKAGQ